MKSLAANKGLDMQIAIDSAGTMGYHTGDSPDPRMVAHAAKRGYRLDHKARKFDPKTDFDKFDFIITMDNSNYKDITAMDRDGSHKERIFKMAHFVKSFDVDEVPDPYYLGTQGFENVLNVLEDGCKGLLDTITKST